MPNTIIPRPKIPNQIVGSPSASTCKLLNTKPKISKINLHPEHETIAPNPNHLKLYNDQTPQTECKTSYLAPSTVRFLARKTLTAAWTEFLMNARPKRALKTKTFKPKPEIPEAISPENVKPRP